MWKKRHNIICAEFVLNIKTERSKIKEGHASEELGSTEKDS